MKKAIVSIVMAIMLVISASPVSLAAESISDLQESDWYYNEVSEMVAEGYISGYPDGSFRGENEVTAAEFITMLAGYKGLPAGPSGGHWAGIQLEAALSAGWVSEADFAYAGYDDPIPRQLAAKILVSALGVQNHTSFYALRFNDREGIAEDYRSYVAAANGAGLFVGDSAGNFSPDGALTRGAAAALIYRSIHNVAENKNGGFPLDKYSKQEIIDYFVEVALNAEFGDTSDRVRKWDAPVYYDMNGGYTEEDERRLLALMAELNEVPGFPGIYPSDGTNTNLTIRFLSAADMDYAPGYYFPGNDGFATIQWTSWKVTRGEVSYLAEGLSQEGRNPTLMEELVQSLGMLNDSYAYPESIFYQDYTDTEWPCEIDWAVISLLYDPAIKPGMTEAECRNILETIIP